MRRRLLLWLADRLWSLAVEVEYRAVKPDLQRDYERLLAELAT